MTIREVCSDIKNKAIIGQISSMNMDWEGDEARMSTESNIVRNHVYGLWLVGGKKHRHYCCCWYYKYHNFSFFIKYSFIPYFILHVKSSNAKTSIFWKYITCNNFFISNVCNENRPWPSAFVKTRAID